MRTEVSSPFIHSTYTLTGTLSVNDSHRQCEPGSPDGCQRCHSPPFSHCCDLCSPLEFVKYTVPFVKVKGTRRSKVPRYDRTSDHDNLEKALCLWRETKALELFGDDVVAQHGVHVLMDDTVIETIVNCLSTMRITTPMDLETETSWPTEWIKVVGGSLLNLILEYYPLPKDDATPTEPSAVFLSPLALPVRTRAVVKCRECGISGHNSMILVL
jgi:hypothetical protein